MSQLTTHATFIFSIYGIRTPSQLSKPTRIHSNTISKFIPRHHHDRNISAFRWDSERRFFLYFFKTVLHIDKYSTNKYYFIPSQHWFSFVLTRTSLYVQLQQIFLFIINLRILSFSQARFIFCPIQTLKHFSLPQHLPTPTTNNTTILLLIPTGKEPTYVEYFIDSILDIVSQQAYPAHYQSKNSESTVQHWIRALYSTV